MALEIRELIADAGIEAAFPLMAELRARIRPQTFLAEVRRQQVEGYHLIGAFEDGTLVALAGIRRSHTLSRGEHLMMTGIPCRIDVATLLDAPERAGR